MCYVLLLSTTSEEELAARNSVLVRFTRDLPKVADTSKLRYPHHWYVQSHLGCSCGFRHLYSIELGFGEPVDWYPEESEEIDATLQLVAIIRRLVERGERVDCVDQWEHKNMHPAAEAVLIVNLSKVADQEFRFFENHHFIFENAI